MPSLVVGISFNPTGRIAHSRTGKGLLFRSQIILRYRRRTPVACSNIMWRHNFYTLFIKSILDILVQIGINLCQLVSIFNICIHLIDRVIILKRRFQYKRTRIIYHSGSIQSSLNQKLMCLPPGNIIPHTHFRMDNQPVVTCRLTKFTVCEDMMKEFGIVTTSFFGVRMRVTNGVFSITFPVVSFSLMRSPNLKGRI